MNSSVGIREILKRFQKVKKNSWIHKRHPFHYVLPSSIVSKEGELYPLFSHQFHKEKKAQAIYISMAFTTAEMIS